MKSMQYKLSISMISAASLVWVACGPQPEVAQSERPTWEAFLAQSTKTYEGRNIYVIEGDIPVSLEELRAAYDRSVAIEERHALEGELDIGVSDRASVVDRHNGQDNVWTAAQAQNLTYCISTNFGGYYARAQAEMAQATASWEAVANVKFTYLSQYDGNCSNSNSAVTFAVRLWNAGGGCAFFPDGDGCVDRTLVMDMHDFDNNSAYGNVTTYGVFMHELGHILGLRHEHIRVATTAFCSESSASRNLTAYDSESVMHYPWCSGSTNNADLYITELDAAGADSLYPRFPGCDDELFFIDGPYPSLTNGSAYVKTASNYLDYPVYQKTSGGYTFSIYRRSNGRWYLDFDGVDESWNGTIAYTTAAANDPWSASWNSGGVSQANTLTLSGGPYASLTNGTFNLSSSHSGGPVYERNGWSIYRRNNNEWHIDFNAVDENWDGTVAYTTGDPKSPWAASWAGQWNNSSVSITPGCQL